MEYDIMSSKLPEIYQRAGKECYLDPIRKKLIYITPEETVRQHIISVLLNRLNVPMNMIRVEERLSHYGIESRKRADIIIEKYNEKENVVAPLAVIECKAPGVLIGEKALEQVIGYVDELNCDYAMITDGQTTFTYKYIEEKNDYQRIESLPEYVSMIEDEFVSYEYGEAPKRIDFEELSEKSDIYIGCDIGESTAKKKRDIMVDFIEALLYCEHTFPCKKYKLFSVIKDYGVRLLTYGDNGGGRFDGPYRSFLIDYDGSTEFVSIAVSSYITSAKPDYVRTVISVAIDNEKETHHALQLVVDDNMHVNGNVCDFYHHGRIGVSNIGSGKVSELREFVKEEMPELICENKFYLGRLTYDRLWNLDDPEMEKLIENFISYALIRDKYRRWLKKNKNKK